MGIAIFCSSTDDLFEADPVFWGFTDSILENSMRTTKLLLVAFPAIVALSVPAQAATVFTDSFDGENGGGTQLNYASFANFGVQSGTVDIIASGGFGITCAGASGSCVDLDGSTGNGGTLVSNSSYAFAAGDNVRLSYALSGNQRVGGSDDWFSGFTFGGTTQINNYGFNYFGSDTTIGDYFTSSISTSTAANLGNAFATRSIYFTAGSAGTLNFFIGTQSTDNIGPILDNVSLDITPAGIGAVPEPATWAMMLLGFGAIGGSIRMRRRTELRFA